MAGSPPACNVLLEVDHLTVTLGGHAALTDCSLHLNVGGSLAVVGESGSGKTTLLKALLGLLPEGAAASGRAAWQRPDGARTDLLRLSARAWRRLRGRAIAWIPQEPAAALDPRMSALAHLLEVLRAHGRREPCATAARARDLLDRVALPLARACQYPHQWSGGMQQRLLVAMALAWRPALLLADEPTSALDPVQQARLLDLLADAGRRDGGALCLVTHDLAVAARAAQRVVVLRHGRVIETGDCRTTFLHPRSAYTAALAAAQPALPAAAAAGAS